MLALRIPPYRRKSAGLKQRGPENRVFKNYQASAICQRGYLARNKRADAYGSEICGLLIYCEIFERCLPASWSMMSVLEILPISRRELRLSTTGSRSALTSRNFSRAVPIPWSGDI